MGENKGNDFWESSNDDFWNDNSKEDDFWGKSSNSEELLKEMEPIPEPQAVETSVEIQKPEMQKPEIQKPEVQKPEIQKPEIQRTESKNRDSAVDPAFENNPYANPYVNPIPEEKKPEQITKQTPYAPAGEQKKSSKTVKTQERVKPQKPEKPEKTVHIHTIICLIFILIAVLSVVTAILASQMMKLRAKKAAEQVSYEETEVENQFVFNENHKITLKDNAYTLVSRENFMGFPEGQKLIGVYVKVESDTYVRDGRILETLYIGYEEDGDEIFKRPVMQNFAETYLATSYIDRDLILSIYGIGNGSDYEGYYFFVVPDTAEEVVLYMEKMKKDHKALVVDTIYYRELPLLSLEESEEQLVQ